MKSTSCLSVLLVAVSVAVSSVDANVYAYNVTVLLGSHTENTNGKLKLSFNNRETTHKVVMSAETERLYNGLLKSYIVAAPMGVEELTSLTFEWSYKKSIHDPSGWLVDPTISLDRVILDPTYKNDLSVNAAPYPTSINQMYYPTQISERRQWMSTYCPAVYTKLKPGVEQLLQRC